jgi:hypothetical protein
MNPLRGERGGVGHDSTHFSAMCCLNKSPVESETISYFRTRRAVRVPLPAPGLPKKIMRSALPLGWDESEPESASGAAAERELRKRNGRAVRGGVDVEKGRRGGFGRATKRLEIIVVGFEVEPGEPAHFSYFPNTLILSDNLVIR